MATSRAGTRGCAAVSRATMIAVHAAWILSVIALTVGAPAFGDSYLLAVEESLNGRKASLPMPVKEGIFDSLFESGHVVFDTKDGAAVPSLPDLLELAQDGGARLLLRVGAISEDTATGGKQRTVTSTATYELYESRTGRILGRGEITGSNSGRESECDGRLLGMEIGKKIIKETDALAAARKTP